MKYKDQFLWENPGSAFHIQPTVHNEIQTKLKIKNRSSNSIKVSTKDKVNFRKLNPGIFHAISSPVQSQQAQHHNFTFYLSFMVYISIKYSPIPSQPSWTNFFYCRSIHSKCLTQKRDFVSFTWVGVAIWRYWGINFYVFYH